MAFQSETGSGSARATSHQDLLNKMVSFFTGRHVASVMINNPGTGGTYAVGDILTLTHAGAHLDAKFEVTGVTTGQIDTLRIICSGSFGDRVNGSVTISNGGSGYSASASNIILELQGGTSRMPAKLLATTNGSGVVTSAVLYEDLGTGGGGVYSATPSYPAATVIVGPSGTSAGTGCTITMGGSTGIIGTTGLSVTGGGGTGATVDITLAETGWTVDERNTNSHSVNSVLNEKTVVLVGDATGLTNKPFIAYRTGSATSGLDTRYFIACFGLIAHNPNLAFTAQNFRSAGQTAEGTFLDGGSYLLCPQDLSGAGADEIDFWFKADDSHVVVLTQLKESASTSDDGAYMQHYCGFMDRVGTETEAAYPHFCFASSRAFNVNPLTGSDSITSMAENRHTGTGCGQFYDFVNSTWRSVQNDDASGTPTFEEEIMLPVGFARYENGSQALDQVVTDGVMTIATNFFKLDRTSASLILRKIPGTTQDEFFLWPLTLVRNPANAVDTVNDRIYGQLRGVFWISSDNGSGARISDFSEDFVTVGSDRYLVFHNHVHIEPYQYIAIKMDV